MNLFRCGCQLDGRYCPTHKDWGCHTAPPLQAFGICIEFEDCPNCFLARLRSVSLSSAATPTRGGRA